LAKQTYINNQIRAKEVRLIDETGKQVGVVSLEEALTKAQAAGLDLIQVTEKVDPPVTRIADYGKYLYQQGKKDKEAKKHTGGDLKEIRLTFNISDHDLQTRVKQAAKFLKRGDNIRINLRLRGRQKALLDHAREKIEKFLLELNLLIPVRTERDMKLEPRGLTMVITKK
jgi:translation initiation factor IF-3